MGPISKKYLKDWQDFISIFESFDTTSKKYIFRGHSNTILEGNRFQEWGLESSFNRNNRKKTTYSFENLLTQHFQPELFRIHYSKYKFPQVSELVNASTLEKCYFFQHYGIPTCFIDFTFNPLVALYFSISSIEGRSGGAYSIDGDPIFYSDDYDRDFVTIYQIDPLTFSKVFKCKTINPSEFNEYNLDIYRIPNHRFTPYSPLLAFDLSPASNSSESVSNFNLKMQEGCFLFYDNEEIGMSLDEYIEHYCQIENIQLEAPLITKYHIKYNSLYKNRSMENRNQDTVFSFLRKKEKIGEFLFNDLQGLKYDFNFFHQQ